MEDPQAVSSAPTPVAAEAGLADNVAGALAYVTIIPAIVFLVMDQYNKRPFVRFNAFQCICLAVVAFGLSVIMIIPILGWIVGIVGDLTLFVFWIICIMKAYQGQLYKVPVIGNYAEKFAAQ
jgi:uncharacterized membrane protein